MNANLWLQRIAKFAELVGAVATAVLAITADGKLASTNGKIAVITASITAVGHAFSHHANPNVTP